MTLLHQVNVVYNCLLAESSNYPNRPVSISKLNPVKTYSTCMTRELLINFQIIKPLSDD